MEKDNIAANLIKYRLLTNSKLKDVEKGTGIKIQTISAYEHGKKTPNIENLCKIAKFYNIDPNSLIEPFFCYEKSMCEYSYIGYLLKFINYSKSKCKVLDDEILIKITPEMRLILENLKLNEWVENKIVKNVSNPRMLSNSIIEQILIEKTFKEKN